MFFKGGDNVKMVPYKNLLSWFGRSLTELWIKGTHLLLCIEIFVSADNISCELQFANQYVEFSGIT